MKIAMRVTIDMDPESWEINYGIPKSELREDMKVYVKDMLQNMPVTPTNVEVS